jgi:hypothetical protein
MADRPNMRDDFTLATKELLAKRVAFRCSNPRCSQVTSGPQEDPGKSINIGVAAHITAASPDGPRYDPTLTPDERRDPTNGIWLCQSCAKLIDSDFSRYTVQVLQEWKSQTEDATARALEQPGLSRENEYNYTKIERLMPDLLADMRKDLTENPLVREFVVLKKGWVYNATGPYIHYDLDVYSNLQEKLRILENYSLIRDITYNSVKRYVMSEQFAEYLAA